MATVFYFEETIASVVPPHKSVTLTVGYLSDKSLRQMYIEIDGQMYVLDPKTAQEFCSKISDLAFALGHDS